MDLSEAWTIQDSSEVYNIRNWGKGYFAINAQGNVSVHPEKREDRSIDLKQLVDQLILRDIELPVLVRFTLNGVPEDSTPTLNQVVAIGNCSYRVIGVLPDKTVTLARLASEVKP